MHRPLSISYTYAVTSAKVDVAVTTGITSIPFVIPKRPFARRAQLNWNFH